MAQVEEIFGEIENMCFLRTGEGMKSVMKTELTVVEAILQAGRCATAAPGAVFPFFFFTISLSCTGLERCCVARSFVVLTVEYGSNAARTCECGQAQAVMLWHIFFYY